MDLQHPSSVQDQTCPKTGKWCHYHKWFVKVFHGVITNNVHLSCHPDLTLQGHTFAHLYPQENNTMASAFESFAKMLFHK